MNEKGVIFQPDGTPIYTDGKKPERIELRPGLIEWFAQCALFAESQKIGLYCSVCKADIVGKNGEHDRVFTATCGCREWVGANREYRPEPTPRVN